MNNSSSPNKENSKITSPQEFNNQFNGTILWNYHTNYSPEALSCIRLIKIADKKRWSPFADISWLIEPINDQFPCTKEADPLVGFNEYEQLPLRARQQISWQRHAMEISEILHGEQLAMMCASQLITLLPCMEGRLFAGRQAADEARHIEFFRAYLLSINMKTYQPSPAIRKLTIEVLQSPLWEIKLLICQVLIESLAMAQFSHLARSSCKTSLVQGLRRIMDDEARHVKFGTDYLTAHFRHCDAGQLRDVGNYVVDKAFGLASSDNYCVAIATPLGWDIHKLRHHLRQQRINKPESFQLRFRQLSININAIGLMDNSIKQRLERFSGI